MKVTYVTKTDEKGNIFRYRKLNQVFKDEDTGEEIIIPRHDLIKVNGDPVRFYSQGELNTMTNKQKQAIKLRLK